jgi:hypothetical protein
MMTFLRLSIETHMRIFDEAGQTIAKMITKTRKIVIQLKKSRKLMLMGLTFW